MLSTLHDPIIAIATSSGKSGIGIIRLSFGLKKKKIVYQTMKLLFGKHLIPRYASYVNFLDKKKNIIDSGIAIFFKKPNSYTGEHVLEIHGHGNYYLLTLLQNQCIKICKNFGLRIAEPGEFTKRAFLNKKIDLIQAEAVIDLINADTEKSIKYARKSLEGSLSKNINIFIKKIKKIIIYVETIINFKEDNKISCKNSKILKKLSNIYNNFLLILKKSKKNLLLKNKLNVIIVGNTNVGKSSIFNCLTGLKSAIVTKFPGTTRDIIIKDIQIDNNIINIIDTAGLRKTDNEIEKIGIKYTLKKIKKADIILYVLDICKKNINNNKDIKKIFPKNIPIIKIWNKIDKINKKFITLKKKTKKSEIYLSAKTGYGIDILKKQILKIYKLSESNENIYIARNRQLFILNKIKKYLKNSLIYFKNNLFDICSENLKISQKKMETIIGKSTKKDLLNEIFKKFCIGK